LNKCYCILQLKGDQYGNHGNEGGGAPHRINSGTIFTMHFTSYFFLKKENVFMLYIVYRTSSVLKVDYYAIYRIMVITKVDTDPIDSISAGPI
jgi:hypothetical protein